MDVWIGVGSEGPDLANVFVHIVDGVLFARFGVDGEVFGVSAWSAENDYAQFTSVFSRGAVNTS